jgi:predicted acyltransferase
MELLQKTAQSEHPPVASKPTSSKILLSLDALRGFDMFLIIGGTYLLETFIEAFHLTSLDWLARQMHHIPWHGLSFEDVIFPLFLYMVGVSLGFSTTSSLNKGMSKNDIYWKAFKRMLLLSLLGIIYKNNPLHFNWDEIRYVSVLGRIGVTGFIATLIVVNTHLKGQILWIVGLLVSYWAAMMFIPVPGYGAGDLSIEGNLAGYIDRIIVPGRLKDGIVDELGYFEHIPSTALVLMGAITSFIFRTQASDYRKVAILSVTGGGLIVLGVLWGFHFPINKHLWSSSFILTTGGISFLFMALFYLVIDVWEYKKWSIPFMIIGVNSIFIYLASSLINFRYTANYLFNGFMQLTDEAGQAFILQLGVLALEFLLLYFLYRKKIFFKV